MLTVTQFGWLASGALFAIVAALHVFRITRVNNGPHSGDAFTYLRLAREIPRQRRLFPEMVFYHTGEREILQLPPLMMALLVPVAGLPYSLVLSLAALLDVVIAVIVVFAGISVFDLAPWRAALAGAMFLLTPINMVTAASLTPRSLGLLWFVVFVLAMTLYIDDPAALWLVLAALAASLAFLSQRMVTQIILLLVPLIAAGFWLAGMSAHGAMLPVTLAGFAGALLLSLGGYWRVITDHARRVFVHMKVGQQQRFRREFGNPRHIIKANPWLLLLVAGLVAGGPLDPRLWLSAAFVAGMLLLAIVWVMGNSVNHMFFASPFVAWLVASVLPDGLPWLAAVAAVGIISGVLVLREYRMLSATQIAPQWLSCFAFIREQGLEGRALVVPMVSFPPLVYYTPLVMIASGHGSKAVTFDRMQIRRQLATPGFLTRSVQDFGVRYLLVDLNSTAPELLAEGGVLRGPEFRQIYANDRVMLLEAATS
jgi:hypothetical protein